MLQTAINSNINGYCEKLGCDCPKQGYNYTATITNGIERSTNVCATGVVDVANKVEV